jgi:poly-gamma-glutamate capsule biosynthesis protein CapA/YwtB (metallophosphatase superfamily)
MVIGNRGTKGKACILIVALVLVLSGCAKKSSDVSTAGTVPPRSFTLVATGDVLIHQDGPLARGAAAAGRVNGTGYDFSGVFAPVAEIIGEADLAVCHLETPVAEAGGPFSGYPLFEVQPQIIDALARAGYDTCSTASNHALDAGFEGLARTLDALDAKGIGHTGTFRTSAESRTPRIFDVQGVRVAHLSWTYGLNGIPVPADRPWSVHVFDPAGPETTGLLADAARARQAGADVVVASVHCCQEYVHDPTPAQVEIATELLNSPDIDLVLGHHSHVVQPCERINGKWVAYGLGNHVAEQGAGDTEDSVITRFTFTESAGGRFAVTRAEAIPTRIDLSGRGVRVVSTAADHGPDSYNRVVEVLSRRGAVPAGLTIAAQ